jgi:hypothetical protein
MHNVALRRDSIQKRNFAVAIPARLSRTLFFQIAFSTLTLPLRQAMRDIHGSIATLQKLKSRCCQLRIEFRKSRV